MYTRSLALALFAATPLLAQEPAPGADAPVSNPKSELTKNQLKESSKDELGAQDDPAPVAPPVVPTAEPVEPPAASPAQDAARAAVETAAEEAVAEETAAPQAEVDRSDWPQLDDIVLDSAAIQRAEEAANDYQLAPERIGAAELRRTLVYLVGSRDLRSFKLDIEIEAEMERQIADGRDPADFEIPEDAIRASIDAMVQAVEEQYPTLDPEDVLRLNNIHPENMVRLQKQSQLFSAVFLPEDPDKWPDVTIEAVRGGGQAQFYDIMRKSFEDLQKRIDAGELTDEEIEKARQGQGTMRQLMSQSVMKALNDSSKTETAIDGLPAEVAMRVNGRDILTDDVFDVIASRVSESDVELARQWILKTRLLERTLAARGYLLSPDEARAAYDEHMEPMMGTMFPPEFFVVNVKGYPSMHLYEELHRYIASYGRMVGDEMTEEALQAHFVERGNDLLNMARVGTEVILLSAYDFPTGTWKENGWADAERRAREVAEKLIEGGGANWGELQDAYSDFWDPPAPTTPVQGQQAPRRKNKGRFAPMARNELIKELGENEFTIFLDGSSITDEIFFNLPEGQIGGPWKGRYGYYIARITAKTTPRGSRTIADPDMRQMVEEDWLTTRFNAFAQELVDAALRGEDPR